MKRAALILIAALAALAAVQTGAAKEGNVLAVVGVGSKARLGYVNPVSLTLVGRSAQVGYYTGPGARSPNGSRLALARSYAYTGLRIMDLGRMRTVKAFRSPHDEIQAIAWVSPRKLVAMAGGHWVFAVDPVTGKPLWERHFSETLHTNARWAGGFVFLSTKPVDYRDAVGPTTLTTVSSSGVVRSIVLDRIRTGFREPDEANPLGAQRHAGLAVDVAGNRAFVVGAGEPVAEIDLVSLAVTYHGGTRTLAKLLDGPFREAAWLPNGTIAVTGYDAHISRKANGDIEESQTPAGLMIVDPRDWSWRTVDRATSSLAVSGDALVSYSSFQSTGLGVYGLDGAARLRALESAVQDVQLGGGMAFATMGDPTSWKLAVVDLRSGRVMNAVSRPNILLVD
jgi:hypothetical protein